MSILVEMFLGKKSSVPEQTETDELFKLPIMYLQKKDLHTLNDTVIKDLEMVAEKPSEDETDQTKENDEKTEDKKGMYDYLFQPTNEFAKNIIPQWSTVITSNTDFLKESQSVIQSMGSYKKNVETNSKNPNYDLSYNKIMEIWKATKEDPSFLERYSYIEFDMFKHLNTMPSFLQAVSLINMASPLLSFMIPFFLFLFPFIILKIQGIPISFATYLEVLQEIARHHFIGKSIMNLKNFNANNVAYFLMSIGLYLYQMYQNTISCMRFYRNINKINHYLTDMQDYLDHSISSMENFAKCLEKKALHAPFSKDLEIHTSKLKSLRTVLNDVQPFEPSIFKIGEIGILLRCFYELHSNLEYEKSLKYSFGFQGYIDNLLGIYDNLENSKIAMCDFIVDPSGEMIVKDQYYPAHIKESYVINDCKLDKNMIITGPNASGKTTFLKTTSINIILSQQFGCGFYTKFSLRPYTHIHSYLNIPDTSGRDSLFQAESRRCKEIIDTILANNKENRDRHFCIFDELYSGTNPVEATKSAYSFLLYLSGFQRVDFILTTHYISICDRLKESEDIRNWKMDALEENDDIKYTYKICEGISNIQGAIKVLKDMKYPKEIIENIEKYDEKDQKERETKEETKEESIEETKEETKETKSEKKKREKQRKIIS